MAMLNELTDSGMFDSGKSLIDLNGVMILFP
jgi:hypothetical protein